GILSDRIGRKRMLLFSASGGTEAVGRATTESVVLSIALIIGLDCVFAFFIY
ncbi:MAG: ABC transporter permease, partial [Acidobacteria bacterium]|nr:ABC transporter permease [Acidobacteriota bacterium]